MGNPPSPAPPEGEIRVARILEGAVRVSLTETDPRRRIRRRVAPKVGYRLDQQGGRYEGENRLPHDVAVGLLGQVPRRNVELIREGGDSSAAVREAGEGNLSGAFASKTELGLRNTVAVGE